MTSWFGRTVPQQFISLICQIITQSCPQIIIYIQPLSPSRFNISHLGVSLSFCQLRPGVFTKTHLH